MKILLVLFCCGQHFDRYVSKLLALYNRGLIRLEQAHGPSQINYDTDGNCLKPGYWIE
jgi:hypothetical protein